MYWLVLLFASSQVVAQSLDSAAAYTNDSQFKRTSLRFDANQKILLDEEENLTTTLGAGAQYSQVERTTSDSVIAQAWDDHEQINETSGSLSLAQDFYKHFGVTSNYSRAKSEISAAYSYSFGIYKWLFRETHQFSGNYTKNSQSLNSVDTIDRDAFRILTPSKISGEVFDFSYLGIVSTTTIVQASVAKIIRTDRPDAQVFSGGLRQFFKPLRGSLHAGLSYFENLGEVKPVTLQGEVTAQSANIEWHQRLFSRSILMAGYRYYTEEELPRATNADAESSGSDWIYTRFSQRLGRKLWTDPADELYLFAGNYRNSDKIFSSVTGIGFKKYFAN